MSGWKKYKNNYVVQVACFLGEWSGTKYKQKIILRPLLWLSQKLAYTKTISIIGKLSVRRSYLKKFAKFGGELYKLWASKVKNPKIPRSFGAIGTWDVVVV